MSRLSNFIKPAAPTEKVRVQLEQNTDSWMAKNMDILYEHYVNVIQFLNGVKKNVVSLQVAKGWDLKRYGACLRASTMSLVEALLDSPGEEGGGVTKPQAECMERQGDRGEEPGSVVINWKDANDILPASLCSPSACPVSAARRDSSLNTPGALPPRSTAHPGPFSSPREGDRTHMPAASTTERLVAKQQKRLKIKSSAQTGGKEVGEMTIEVLQQQDQVGNMSCDSLDRADPHHFNFKSNFHLSEEVSESNDSADEFKTVGPKKRAEGRSRCGSTRDEEVTGAGAEAETVGGCGTRHHTIERG